MYTFYDSLDLRLIIRGHAPKNTRKDSFVNPDQQFWWNWGVNLSVAVFTFLAVLVALFGEKLRARFFPPILKLKLLRKEGEKAPLTRLNEQGVVEHVDDSRYYHLHVWNERRCRYSLPVSMNPDQAMTFSWRGRETCHFDGATKSLSRFFRQ
ncbi:MAG: hypothetical protein DMG39_27220 [Acidobacteria bacterium]|nr:MAG: hypothetical protein DMG39_27220 [Acidobacteriota bacterium]